MRGGPDDFEKNKSVVLVVAKYSVLGVGRRHSVVHIIIPIKPKAGLGALIILS